VTSVASRASVSTMYHRPRPPPTLEFDGLDGGPRADRSWPGWPGYWPGARLLLDAQATGGDPARGALLEIGWARWSAGEARELPAAEVTAHVVAPPSGAVVPPAVARLTGLRTAGWARGMAPALAWKRLLRAAERVAPPPGPVPVVIHFARFEEPLLRAQHQRHGAGPFPFDLVCTHVLAHCQPPIYLPEPPERFGGVGGEERIELLSSWRRSGFSVALHPRFARGRGTRGCNDVRLGRPRGPQALMGGDDPPGVRNRPPRLSSLRRRHASLAPLRTPRTRWRAPLEVRPLLAVHEEKSHACRLVTCATPLTRRQGLTSSRGRASVGRAGSSNPAPAPQNALPGSPRELLAGNPKREVPSPPLVAPGRNLFGVSRVESARQPTRSSWRRRCPKAPDAGARAWVAS
jgi:hypothetical protein